MSAMDRFYSTGYAYDAEDAENLRYAVEFAKRDLGRALQDRGILTEITFVTASGRDTGNRHPLHAGELAAAKLNLGQADLAAARAADIARWVDEYQRGLPLLVRIEAAIADVTLARRAGTAA